MQKEEIDIVYPASVDEWREWLAEYHRSKSAVWLVQHHKASKKPTISWSEAVEVALCYGWIDSKKIAVGEGTTHQFFSKRKAKSTWSKINKDKVAKLIADGLMTEAGFESIKAAQQNGSWTLLDEVEALKIPDDLERAFNHWTGSKEYFLGLSKSAKKGILYWVISAKRPETRQKRVEEIAELAAQGKKPKQF
ncbi:MAG TPA: YdeI/OmpD-associated family protein [Cyclobacteriaceae bacterium]|nr:YdeI/OmpD-associated family protein [Cyclobacteriaceae bacterium]